ncbi:antibiotic biosynthesis monooxygenase [Salipiger bermudensis]|uniref:putative quinol monooxygenase n=1 Tax=Salipiger bermudensis TaxID=344736 RepID=UPI001C9A1FC3|nr:antibiotic biosynthesis monooxygenase [Salipiger bermudensis]MBY6006324.1 antibiotic biosynthesis monooxygenase [Salipiger bermudensis]
MPEIRLTGTMTCPPERAEQIRAALPEHIRLTRAEPGCLSFEVIETAPCVFTVAERFTDCAAFDAHQSRARASDWARVTAGCARDYAVTEA